jgi:uncharacterized protein with PhoU and TrkA domain
MKAGSMRYLVMCLALAAVLCSFCGKEEAADESRALEDRLERLRSVPYTATTEEVVPVDLKGVTLHDPARASIWKAT